MANTRTQRAYQQVDENGILKVQIYGLPDASGKQTVKVTKTYDTNMVADKMQGYFRAKGAGFYMAGDYADDCDTPEDVEAACDNFWKSVEDGSFTPGRTAGEAKPSAFQEALAEHLGQPVADVVALLKSDPKAYSKTNLSAMAKLPQISVIIKRIEKERAAAAEKLAKGRLKTGSSDSDLLAKLRSGLVKQAAE